MQGGAAQSGGSSQRPARDSAQSGGSSQRPAHVSAASGMVRLGSKLYVVPDDELMLARFSLDSAEPGEWIRIFDGDLPREHEARKKEKPDWEAITLLRRDGGSSQTWIPGAGALLLVPSGSKPNRGAGALLQLNEEREISGSPLPLNLNPLYERLRLDLGKLNIEGIVSLADRMILFNRGNGKKRENAIVTLHRERFVRQIYDTHELTGETLRSYKSVHLGDIDGVKLTFTDACVLSDGRIVFSATAEDTDDAYEDGACRGSMIGIINQFGDVMAMERVEIAEPPSESAMKQASVTGTASGAISAICSAASACPKIEGVSAELHGDEIELLMATDADDEAVPSKLLWASWRPDLKSG